MKILIVTHYFASNNCGIEIIAKHIRDGLLAKGNEVRWIAASVQNSISYSVPENEEELGIPAWDIIRVKWDLAFPLFSPHHIIRIWKEVSQSDVIHLHEAFFPLNQVVLWIAFLLRKPVVITQHIADMPVKGILRGRAVALANLLMTRPAFALAERICFYSERTRAHFAAWTKNKGCFIRNGCDHRLFHPVSETQRHELRIKYNLPTDKTLVLFVGRFIEKKGLLKLESLVRANPQLHFLFIGKGPIDPRRWKAQNITTQATIEHDRLKEYYQLADALILPAVGEGMPLVVQEAMCAGLNVIVSREIIDACPAIKEWVLDAGLEGNSINTAVHALESLPNNDDNRSHIATFAKSLWNWNQCVDAYEKIFGTVMTETRKSY